MSGSSSYNPKACCGTDCYRLSIEDEPCWGDVTGIDYWNQDTEEEERFHACQGHIDMPDGGDYRYEAHRPTPGKP